VISVVDGIGHDDLGRQSFNQRCSLWHITSVTGGESEPDGATQASDCKVYFGAQTPA
jgi:hypothetical protein